MRIKPHVSSGSMQIVHLQRYYLKVSVILLINALLALQVNFYSGSSVSLKMVNLAGREYCAIREI